MARELPIFVHSTIDDMTDLTPNAMRVYMHLSRRADSDGLAWPSYQAIGDHCFKSVSDNAATRKTFARKAVDELVAVGVISKEGRARDDGGQTSNGYMLAPLERFTDPMPIKHGGVLNNTPMLNEQTPCLIGTPRAYEGTKENPNEDTPNKSDDDDGSRKRMGGVYEVWTKNIPGMLSEILGQKLADLVEECGEPSVIYGIHASIDANARNFKYVAACARNHAAGKQPPPKANQRAPATQYANGNSKVASSLSAIDQYEQIKASHGVVP